MPTRTGLTALIALAAVAVCATVLGSAGASVRSPIGDGGGGGDANGCLLDIENPHFSSGAGGVIAKLRISCADVPTNVSFGGRLWHCGSAPQRDETWLENNCALQAQVGSGVSITAPTDLITRYIPDLSYPGAPYQPGYWIACSGWQSTGPNGTGAAHMSFSNIVYL
jgi:hypothetical protein